MAASDITAAAAAICDRLETLPGVNEAFPYAKPVSAMQVGDLLLMISGSSPPETMGRQGYQLIIWSCLVKLASGMLDVDGGAELQTILTKLSSAEKGEGIIGILRDSPDLDRNHGSPRVTEDGVEIVYDEEADENILTYVQCSISAQIRVS